MGRIAGVTAAETRDRLLRAAADVFARRGYDGTRVADIAAAAGVSNGALYAHFGSKAELIAAALHAHGPGLLAELLAADPARPVADLLVAVGRRLPHRLDARSSLIAEALVAARRDEDVARPMREYVAERAGWLTGLVRGAQDDGAIDSAVSPGALAHLCLLLAMGSVLVTPDLHGVGDEEWSALLTRLVAALAPAGPHPQPDPGSAGSATMKVQIDPGRCQGHGRCHDLAPGLFEEDDEGYGRVPGDGVVPPGQEQAARLAAANCPERAVVLTEEA
ncbi:TetR family transcriptional regulator [Microbispora amethystogenes]|uniref:TetR family transcriptional regulator n=1 Tax=Microbispora amethystogenes TaxID=1427754 RepID=UPI0033D412AA